MSSVRGGIFYLFLALIPVAAVVVAFLLFMHFTGGYGMIASYVAGFVAAITFVVRAIRAQIRFRRAMSEVESEEPRTPGGE